MHLINDPVHLQFAKAAAAAAAADAAVIGPATAVAAVAILQRANFLF